VKTLEVWVASALLLAGIAYMSVLFYRDVRADWRDLRMYRLAKRQRAEVQATAQLVDDHIQQGVRLMNRAAKREPATWLEWWF
jgi:hypothetical protein